MHAKSSSATTSSRRSRPARCTRIGIRWRPRSRRPLDRQAPGRDRADGAGRRRSRTDAAARTTIRFGSMSRSARWSLAQGHRAGARVGHDAGARRSSTRAPATCRCRRRCETVQHRLESVGPVDRMRRPRGSVGRAARRHLHADARAAGLSRRTGLHRDRRSSAACRSRANGIDMPLLELIESLDTIAGRARRRPHRHGREPADRDQVARSVRGAGRRACCTPRTASSRSWSSRATSSASSTTWRAPTRTRSTTASGSRRRARRSTRSSRRFSRASPDRCGSSCSRATAASSAAGRAYALYDRALATYDAGDQFDHDARPKGSSRSGGLPIETAARKAARARGAGRSADDGAPLVRPVRGRSRCRAVRVRRLVRFDRRLFEDDVREAWRGRRRSSAPGVLSHADASAIRDRARRTSVARSVGSGVLRHRRRAAATKTFTRSSSASSSRGSATPADGCTPAGRATNRSRSICACI